MFTLELSLLLLASLDTGQQVLDVRSHHGVADVGVEVVGEVDANTVSQEGADEAVHKLNVSTASRSETEVKVQIAYEHSGLVWYVQYFGFETRKCSVSEFSCVHKLSFRICLM